MNQVICMAELMEQRVELKISAGVHATEKITVLGAENIRKIGRAHV